MITLANLQPIAPQPEHAALAAARVPFVRADANAAAVLRQAATALGMTVAGPDQYVDLKDNSFVALDNGRVQRGLLGTGVFSSRPVDLGQLPVAAIGAFAKLQASQIDAALPVTVLVADLTRLGFAQVTPNYFVHNDTSWVAIVPDLGLVRGVGQQRLDPKDLVKPTTAAPAAAAPAAAAPAAAAPAAPKPVRTPDSVVAAAPKTRAPTFEDGFLACALPGRLAHNAIATDRPQFAQWGFTETSPGSFEHGDGSWVAYLANGTIERGLLNQTFQRVPVSPARMSPVAPSFTHLGMACSSGKLATLTAADVIKGDKALKDAGFAETRLGLWQHKDGSFVAAAGPTVHFGVGQQLLTALPSANTLPVIGGWPANISAIRGFVGLPDDVKQAPQYFDAQVKAGTWQETRPGYFTSGNLWAVADGQQLVVGMGPERYKPLAGTHVPVVGDLTQTPVVASDFAAVQLWAGFAAAGKAETTKAFLKQQGFSELLVAGDSKASGSGLWVNGSEWALVDAQNGVLAGNGNGRYAAIPSMASLPSVPVDLNAMQVAANLWNLPTNSAQAAKAQLAKNGFTESRPGYFTNGSLWLAVDNGQFVAGTGQSRYAQLPTPTTVAQIKSGTAHMFLAIAKAHQVVHTDPNLAQTLQGFGFTAQPSGLFTAADGSWIFPTATGLVRGHKGEAFSDVPQPPAPGSYPVYTAIPPGTWVDWQNLGIAISRAPMLVGTPLTQQEFQKVMTHLGFAATGSGVWQHPDGSKLQTNMGSPPGFVSSSFQQWGFGQFPYKNATDYNSMIALTQKWAQWARAGGTPPF